MTERAVSFGFGYLFSVAGSAWVIGRFIKKARKATQCEDDSKGLGKAIGVIESVLFTSAFHFGHINFIPWWVTLKTAIQWKALSPDHYIDGEQNQKNPPRLKYENNGRRFLAGIGLSILFSYTGFRMIELFRAGDILNGLLWPAVLLIGGFCFSFLVHEK